MNLPITRSPFDPEPQAYWDSVAAAAEISVEADPFRCTGCPQTFSTVYDAASHTWIHGIEHRTEVAQ